MQTHRIQRLREQRRGPRLAALVAGLLMAGVLLTAADARAEQAVQGAVSGVWTTDESPYRVVADIVVEVGEELTIEPGVIVIVDGNFSFDVHGLLAAVGQDGARRIWIGNDAPWRGLFFHPEASSRSALVNCDLVGGWTGVQINRTYINIQFCRIEAIAIGINCIRSSPDIHDNLVIRAVSNNTLGDVRAISLNDFSSPRIVNNTLVEARGQSGGEAYGVWMNESSPIIRDNWIEVASETGAYGIYARRTSKIRIERNIIRLFSSVKMRGVWLVYASGVRFVSNDLFLMATSRNAVGLLIDVGSLATITNNIVIGNQLSIGDSTVYGEVDADNSGYNDYWMHETNHVGDWQGGVEINADPLFASQGMDFNPDYYRLSWPRFPDPAGRSPCIDAGSPALLDPDDPYNTLSDIGRYPYIYDPDALTDSEPDAVASDFNFFGAYPNPFNRRATLSFDLALPGQASVTVFDLNGRQLKTLWDGPLGVGNHRLDWSAEGFSAGEYLVRFALPGDSRTARLILLP